MAIQVIGAGLGRTGTLSLKGALEQLGFGPCYHMVEVLDREHSEAWRKASFEGTIDWSVFDGFQSVVDWPAVSFWRELIAHYPQAKVILTLRDGDSWHKSVMDTIYTRMTMPLPADAPPERLAHRAMTSKLILEKTFGGRIQDKQHAIEVMQRHNDAVRGAVESSRLLVFHVKEGWEPLCAFLGVQVPDEPFPRLNDTGSFRERTLAWDREDGIDVSMPT